MVMLVSSHNIAERFGAFAVCFLLQEQLEFQENRTDCGVRTRSSTTVSNRKSEVRHQKLFGVRRKLAGTEVYLPGETNTV